MLFEERAKSKRGGVKAAFGQCPKERRFYYGFPYLYTYPIYLQGYSIILVAFAEKRKIFQTHRILKKDCRENFCCLLHKAQYLLYVEKL